MFDGDHDWLDDLTNDMDSLHVYDLDGDGYTSFDEEYLLTHDHDEDSQNVSSDDDCDEFSDEFDEFDRDEYGMDDLEKDNSECSDEPNEECDKYGDYDSYDDESDASMEPIDESSISQKPEKLLYAKVKLGDSSFGYSYRCNDQSIKAGDKVIVPVGDKQEIIGTVISVDSYTLDQVPYPIEKTKFILRKVEKKAPTNQYVALASTLQKVSAMRTYSTKGASMRHADDGIPKYTTMKSTFSTNTTPIWPTEFSDRGNFGIVWFVFILLCFFPFLFAEFALDAIFFDPGATDGIHVFLALAACIACGFGYARYERAKAKKDSEALHNAKILSISVAVICVVISLIIIGISSANEKERQMEKDRLLSSSRRPYYSTSITSSSSSSNSKSTSSSKNTTSRKSSSSKKSSSSYNAKDYAHPDDFYYDHYDDFVDFEEAEDYWDDYD